MCCLKISGLEYGIINKELHVRKICVKIYPPQALFEELGEMKKCQIDWDEMGRSKVFTISPHAKRFPGDGDR